MVEHLGRLSNLELWRDIRASRIEGAHCCSRARVSQPNESGLRLARRIFCGRLSRYRLMRAHQRDCTRFCTRANHVTPQGLSIYPTTPRARTDEPTHAAHTHTTNGLGSVLMKFPYNMRVWPSCHPDFGGSRRRGGIPSLSHLACVKKSSDGSDPT